MDHVPGLVIARLLTMIPSPATRPRHLILQRAAGDRGIEFTPMDGKSHPLTGKPLYRLSHRVCKMLSMMQSRNLFPSSLKGRLTDYIALNLLKLIHLIRGSAIMWEVLRPEKKE